LIVKYNVVVHNTLIPIELLPYLQCVAITETKGSLDELVTFNYMYIVYTIYFKYRTFNLENCKKKRRNEPKN
jgi:hypothetical protein